jgi:hypothetical protein
VPVEQLPVLVVMAQVLEVKMVTVVVTMAVVRSGLPAAMSAAGGGIGHNRERRGCERNRSDGGQKCAGGSHWRILGSGSSGETEPARANTTGRALHRDLLSTRTGRSRR